MTSIYDYTLAAAGNTASPPDGFGENQLASQVDDTFRKLMSNVGEFSHSTVAGGSADALTVTLTNVPSSLTDGMQIHVRAIAANLTTTPTLNLNSLGAKTITKLGGIALAAGDIAGALHELNLRYNLANTRWELLNPGLTNLTNSLSGDVSISATGTYFDGPSVAQGTVGTWFASGTVTVVDTQANTGMFFKLWDGTTVIANAGGGVIPSGNEAAAVSLSGVITNPAGNLRISVHNPNSTTAVIKKTQDSINFASTITAIRIQ